MNPSMEVPSPSGALVEMLAAMTIHDVADLAERLGVPVNDVSRLALAAARARIDTAADQ